MLDYAFKPLLQSIKNNHCTQVLVPGVGVQEKKVKVRASWTGHTDYVSAVTVLSDGTVVSGSYDKTLRHWDPQTGQCLNTWTGHTNRVSAVTVLPDGTVVSGSWDKTLRHWDPQTGQCLNTWTGHTSYVLAVAVLPDGAVVSGSEDNTLRHWDPQTGQCLNTWRGHMFGVSAVVVLPDGTVVSGSDDHTLRHWNPQTGQCLNTWEGHTHGVTAVTVLPDGMVVSGSKDKTLRHWYPKTGQCLNTWTGHTSVVSAVIVLPDSSVMSASWDYALRHWDPQTGRCLNTRTGYSIYVNAVTVLPDGTVVSGSSDNTLFHWLRVGPTLTVAQLDEVLRALPSNTSVITLSITDAALTDTTVALLAQGIQNHPTLTTLTLDRCGLTQRQVQALLAALIKSTCSVKTVSVADNGLSSTLLEQFKDIVGLRQRQQTAELPAAALVSASVSSSAANKPHTPAPRPPSASKPSTPPPAVVQVKALYSYIAQGAGQLSFHEGELFQLLNGEGDDWWQVVHKGQQGWVPRSYVAVVDKSAKPVAPASPVAAPSSNSPSTTSLVNYPSLPRPSSTPVLDGATGQVRLSFEIGAEALTYEMQLNPRTQMEERVCLGRGGFGAVYKATWRHQPVAVKVLMSQGLTASAQKEFMNEVQVMVNLRVPQVVALYGMSLTPRYQLVMEYCHNGSLFGYLQSNQPMDWGMRGRIALEIAQGLAFLHACQPPILHRDLKSHNVLLDRDCHAKLSDFGLSKIKQESRSSASSQQESVGTVAWMAPELFRRRAKYELGSDMYSYGMVLWELTTRTMPWSDAHNNALIIQWVSQGDREDIPPSTPLPIATLIRKCWASDPAERPSAEQAMQMLAQSLGELEKLDSPVGGSVSSLSQAVPGSHDVVYTGVSGRFSQAYPNPAVPTYISGYQNPSAQGYSGGGSYGGYSGTFFSQAGPGQGFTLGQRPSSGASPSGNRTTQPMSGYQGVPSYLSGNNHYSS